MTQLYNKTIKDLSNCYDIHADKFSSTRQKKRPEVDYIIEQLLTIQKEGNKPLSIIELGCGDGRFLGYVESRYPHLIKEYKGIDISENLLSLAKNKFSDVKKAKWIKDDMINYLNTCTSESIDVVICIASFQHLPDLISRKAFLHNVYRILCYNGYFFSVDRSRSIWMIQKHGKLVIDSIKKYITTLGKWERNNIMIPFSNQGKDKLLRLYHIFTISELKSLFTQHGFFNGTYIYSSQDGSFHYNIMKARNICSFVQKKVFF